MRSKCDRNSRNIPPSPSQKEKKTNGRKNPKLFVGEVQQRDNAKARAFIGPQASLEDLSREERVRRERRTKEKKETKMREGEKESFRSSANSSAIKYLPGDLGAGFTSRARYTYIHMYIYVYICIYTCETEDNKHERGA